MTKEHEQSGRGTITQFDRLHGLLVSTMERELERCLTTGETPSPAFLAQARQLLSDNDVIVPAQEKRFDNLRAHMPDFDALERGEVVVPFNKCKEAS